MNLPSLSLFITAAVCALAFTAPAPAAAPVANPDTVITRSQDDAVPIPDLVANDTDTDGDSLTLFSVTQGEFGDVGFDASNNSAVYFPSRGFAGSDTFTYVIRDSSGESATGVVTIRNPFLLGRGSYGAAIQAETPTHQTSGHLLLELSFNGSFSAQIRFAGDTFRIKGVFETDGTFTTQLVNAAGSRTLELSLPLDGGAPVISGSLAGVPVSAARNEFSPENPAPRVGAFTFVLPPPGLPSRLLPGGAGFGTLTINSSGSARMSGKLGDGARFSSSVFLDADGTLPFYATLYAVPGSIFGTVGFADGAGSTGLSATLDWFKPAQRDEFYPRGFNTAVQLRGANYAAPAISGFPLAVRAGSAPNATFTISRGGIRRPKSARATIRPHRADAPDMVRFGPANSLRPELTINASTGTFSGSFAASASGPRLRFSGALVQGSENFGLGFFVGGVLTGQVSLTPD